MRLAFIAAAFVLASEAGAASLCDVPRHNLRGVEKETWTAGVQRLVVCTSPDTEFYLISSGRTGQGLILLSDRNEWDVEIEPPMYKFTIYTWRSADEPRVPLIRCEVRFSSIYVKHRTYFVMRGKPFSEERFQRHLQDFRNAAADENRQRELLYTMRDEGISRPKRALQLLSALEAEGVIAKELAGVIGDLQLARDYPHAR